jgi:hypothetical protein
MTETQDGQANLTEIVLAFNISRRLPRHHDRRQQEPNQERDDQYHNQ